MICAYCQLAPVQNKDHVIPKARLRNFNAHRKVRGAPPIAREFRHATVGACHSCNIRKGSRLYVPSSWADRIEELSALGLGIFQVWDGGRHLEVA